MSATREKPVTTENTEPMETTQETVFNSLVGINEAARLTQRSKGQISKDTTSGKLSFVLNERGNKEYQVSELARVYGLKTSHQDGSENREQPQSATVETISKAAEVAVLKTQLAMQNEIIKDLRADKEKLWEQLQHQLPAPQPAAAPPAPKSFWQRIFNR